MEINKQKTDTVEMREGCHISTKDGSYAQIHIHPFQDKVKGPAHSCTSEFK